MITHPFDAAAPTYDSDFTERRLGRWLRERVWEQLEPYAQAGTRVLELNCGTGEDALWLARRGCHVTATDVSPAMLTVAQRKAEAAAMGDRITFAVLDLNTLDETAEERKIKNQKSKIKNQPFDLVFSNFGGLNCVEDRPALAAWLAGQVRPGGHVALVPMGTLCPWEIGWHLVHGKPRTAFRRFRSGIAAHVGDGETVRVWYPTPRRLRAEFAPNFRHVKSVGIGTLLPPSYLDHLVERWPQRFSTLARADSKVGEHALASWLSDHYLTILQRK